MNRFTPIVRLFTLGFVFIFLVVESQAQTTRPRRVSRSTQKSTTTTKDSDPLLRPEPTPAPTAKRTSSDDSLLGQKQFAAAAKEAKELAALHPNDPEAWKIAGFAELNLKQYADAAKDLEKAIELQRSTKQEDPNTESALAQ